MRSILYFLFHALSVFLKLCRSGGIKSLAAENIMLRQQLTIIKRRQSKCQKLTPITRIIFGFLSAFINPKRLFKTAIIIKPATILKFHRALRDRKYRVLFSNKTKRKPGPVGPNEALIKLILEMKQCNPNFGYQRIAMQIHVALGIKINKDIVRRVLAKYSSSDPKDNGPSWLTLIGQMKDSLWSVDFFRCESALMQTHWVMLVMDQFTRRIIGFSVYRGSLSGPVVCRMFAEIIRGMSMPTYLSSDWDPLFTYHQWRANLRILEIEEIKTVPYVPLSHPFVERLIGTVRREYLDKLLFFTSTDLQRKLEQFKKYYNEQRGHSSRGMKTPVDRAELRVNIDNYSWKQYCRGLFQLPVAA